MTGVEGRSLSPWDWSLSLARRDCGTGAGSSQRRGGFRHTHSIPSTDGREGRNSWALQHKLTYERLRLDIRSLFTVRTTKWWNWGLGRLDHLHPWGFHVPARSALEQLVLRWQLSLFCAGAGAGDLSSSLPGLQVGASDGVV